MRTAIGASVFVTACALGAPAHAGFAFGDRSFFEGREHTFLSFDTRGDGTPLPNLPAGESILMPPDEYAQQGVRIGPVATYSYTPPPVLGTLSDNDDPGGPGDAHDAVGSRPVAVRGGPLVMEFLQPMRAVGVALVQTNFAFPGFSEEGSTGYRVYGVEGQLLADVRLWGDLIDGFFDGTITSPDGEEFGRIRYGFVGYAGDELIGRIEFVNTVDAIADDLHFSAVPAPGAGVVLGLLGLCALKRRRTQQG